LLKNIASLDVDRTPFYIDSNVPQAIRPFTSNQMNEQQEK
jgi:hypothetical protein